MHPNPCAVRCSSPRQFHLEVGETGQVPNRQELKGTGQAPNQQEIAESVGKRRASVRTRSAHANAPS
ncbi:MAG: hypothetical protein RBU37_20010 [Myxococcota bacterium]|nr:hypothetical protein [Myxococcota bacterium]